MPADDGYSPFSGAQDGPLLEDLYRSYREPLVTFLERRVPEKSTAADLAHAIFVKLASGGALPSIRNARQYLYRAARNQLADYYRTSGRESERAEAFATDPSMLDPGDAMSPEEEAIRQDKLARLHAIIEAMPEKRRTVFLLARFREWTETEIAAHMGLTPTAVRQHVSRAMRDCQIEMRRIFEEDAVETGDARKRNGRAPQER